MKSDLPVRDSPQDGLLRNQPGSDNCWNTIGVSGDRSCAELNTHVHCRNCPVFAGAARSFFERPAPKDYLADWSRWLAESAAFAACGDEQKGEADHLVSRGESQSVLIFRLGEEWLAFRTQTVAEVTLPRPVHRIPHRTSEVLTGIVSLQGQVQLCVSLYGLLGATAAAESPSRLVVLRDVERAETWVFTADEVVGVRRVPRKEWRNVPSTLINPAVGFSQAVLDWNGHSVGLLDEQRVFSALRSLRT
jgi:chemotaxis-related protein WspD